MVVNICEIIGLGLKFDVFLFCLAVVGFDLRE